MRTLLLLAGLAALAACSDEAPARETSAPDSGGAPAAAAPATSQTEAPALPPVPPGAPLDSLDWGVAGLPWGADSALVRRTLGAPDSVVTHENPFEGGEMPSWYYRDLVVGFTYDSASIGYSLTGPRFATRRGVGVGDTAARVMELYGKPTGTYEEDLDYEDPADNMHVIRFMVQGGRVREIYLGWIMD